MVEINLKRLSKKILTIVFFKRHMFASALTSRFMMCPNVKMLSVIWIGFQVLFSEGRCNGLLWIDRSNKISAEIEAAIISRLFNSIHILGAVIALPLNNCASFCRMNIYEHNTFSVNYGDLKSGMHDQNPLRSRMLYLKMRKCDSQSLRKWVEYDRGGITMWSWCFTFAFEQHSIGVRLMGSNYRGKSHVTCKFHKQ